MLVRRIYAGRIERRRHCAGGGAAAKRRAAYPGKAAIIDIARLRHARDDGRHGAAPRPFQSRPTSLRNK